MIDFNADIISYKSLGNIEIGRNVEFYIDEMYKNFDVKVTQYVITKAQEKEEIRYSYSLNNDTIKFSTNIDGQIIMVGCNENYRGKYKNKLYAGITMGKLISLTNKQWITFGTLIVDKDFGMYFILPSPYDEIADYLKDIPLNLILNEIYVGNFDSWR
ncbi:hypothetical protein GY065_12700 [Snodgrassella sp. ESL0323]|uniref:hypothetical protein n=1 Tax=Snodgrassella sp. ESL0323 TaxID=2705034 RepID=UPI00158347D1|nr:hypothetical protein [Snodgrassella sp. ESL0323]NUF79757.1 hypothetical protein [Snodgrassella sp. ESL0323]